jgi:hypothetical protein
MKVMPMMDRRRIDLFESRASFSHISMPFIICTSEDKSMLRPQHIKYRRAAQVPQTWQLTIAWMKAKIRGLWGQIRAYLLMRR